MIELRTRLSCLQKECDQYKAKNREQEAYLSTLPTEDELNQVTKSVTEAKSEIDRLKVQNSDFEKRLLRAKHFIKEKVRRKLLLFLGRALF